MHLNAIEPTMLPSGSFEGAFTSASNLRRIDGHIKSPFELKGPFLDRGDAAALVRANVRCHLGTDASIEGWSWHFEPMQVVDGSLQVTAMPYGPADDDARFTRAEVHLDLASGAVLESRILDGQYDV